MKITTSIQWTRRGKNTASGNPMYAIATTEGQVYITERDAAICHAVEQFDPTKTDDAPTEVVLTLREGRVINIEGSAP